MIRNDHESPGEIHPIALMQLAPYQEAAWEWPVLTREINVCGYCSQNLWFTNDVKGQPYPYTSEELQALIVAHIRQVHSEMVK